MSCSECGKQDSKCASDKPVKNCDCYRCLYAKNESLKLELEVAQAFHNVAVKERDAAQILLTRSEKQVATLLDQIENFGCAASHYGERTYECNVQKPCGLCRLRSKASAAVRIIEETHELLIEEGNCDCPPEWPRCLECRLRQRLAQGNKLMSNKSD